MCILLSSSSPTKQIELIQFPLFSTSRYDLILSTICWASTVDLTGNLPIPMSTKPELFSSTLSVGSSNPKKSSVTKDEVGLKEFSDWYVNM